MTRKKKKKQKKYSSRQKGSLRNLVLEFFDHYPGRSFSARQLAKRLGAADKKTEILLSDQLSKLNKEGRIKQIANGKFQSLQETVEVTGKVDHVNPRFGYVQVEGVKEDIWVPTKHLKGALHGDEVKLMVMGKRRKTSRPEGRVKEIIQRLRTEFVGKVEVRPGHAWVIPDNRRIYTDIFIRTENLEKAKNNDKVIVEILQWGVGNQNPEGKVKETLGPAGNHEAEIHSIMAEFNLPFRFSEQVEQAANQISARITPSEIKKRKDLRKVTTFTIDPLDAKDFDDALSLHKLSNGNYEVGIHIADVSNYLQLGTLLEKEALLRGTSVYLVDRTIPMLPERLSNELCSLRPREEKLTFSAIFELTEEGKIKNQWFGKTIIKSDRRFTYEEAQERIETEQGDFSSEIKVLNQLAGKLRTARYEEGSINFETVEVKFRLSKDGKPLEIIPKVRQDAHKLVEEFMLLANKKVAQFVFDKLKKKPEAERAFVYRTHDPPDPEKLKDFSRLARKFGYRLDLNNGSISGALNNLIEQIEGKPEQNILESLAIRTMAKAKYTTDPNGHFGLGFSHYTHFTSPIRRYPDLMVHRLLEHYLKNGKSLEREKYEKESSYASEMELKAVGAERASIKFKQVEYMSEADDKNYEGIVSGVSEWGIFVELVETKCEGMVRVSEMFDDYYEFDEKNFRVIGKRNKRIISLGDTVQVRVTKCDIDRRTIDLVFV